MSGVTTQGRRSGRSTLIRYAFATGIALVPSSGVSLAHDHAGESRVSGQENCQVQSDPVGSFNMAGMSDLGCPPTGTAIADDFVPSGDTLTTITVFGTYMGAKGDGPTGPQGSEQYECVWKVPPEEESFRVRIYDDGGRCAWSYPDWLPCESNDDCSFLEGYCLNRQPRDLISEQSLSGAGITRAPYDGAAFETTYGFGMQAWTLELSPVVLAPGAIYWLEITSDRNVCPDGECADGLCDGGVRHGQPCNPDSTCYWHWWQTYREGVANDWSVYGTNDHPTAGSVVGSGYVPGVGKAVDLQFCLAGPTGPFDFTAPVAPTGACCDCDDVCTEDVTIVGCREVLQGVWSRGMTCAYPGVCFDLCDDCDRWGPAIVVSDGMIPFDTTCYTTDGPEFPAGGNEDALGKDIWFPYTATCSGTLVASMCMSGNYHGAYDSFMAIYHDPDFPYDCPCPGSGPAPDWQLGYSNEGCNGIADGGGGIMDGIIVFLGECYLIRIGGWGQYTAAAADAGRGAVDIACIPFECIPSSPPRPETLPLPGDPVNHKVRYLSFRGGDPGRNQAVRVTFDDLPAPYEAWNGTVMWVQEPEACCENAGSGCCGSIPISTCCPNPVGFSKAFWGAMLGCEPYYTDWSYYDDDWWWLSGPPGVHVSHEGIVPRGIYQVQLIDETCLLDLEEHYSDPLTITMSRWGDLVKDCTTDPCGPPDGSTGIVDVTASLDKFKNLSGCVSKTRADIEGSPAGNALVPDQLINITDVTFCLGAFLGETYPPPGFPPPSPPPSCP